MFQKQHSLRFEPFVKRKRNLITDSYPGLISGFYCMCFTFYNADDKNKTRKIGNCHCVRVDGWVGRNEEI